MPLWSKCQSTLKCWHPHTPYLEHTLCIRPSPGIIYYLILHMYLRSTTNSTIERALALLLGAGPRTSTALSMVLKLRPALHLRPPVLRAVNPQKGTSSAWSAYRSGVPLELIRSLNPSLHLRSTWTSCTFSWRMWKVQYRGVCGAGAEVHKMAFGQRWAEQHGDVAKWLGFMY